MLIQSHFFYDSLVHRTVPHSSSPTMSLVFAHELKVTIVVSDVTHSSSRWHSMSLVVS